MEYVLLLPELHDVKTETSMSCKELFDSVHFHSIEKVEAHNFNFYLNRIKVWEWMPMYSFVGTF